MTTAARATMGSEHAEQVALVQWAAWKQGAAVGAGRAMGGDSVTETLKAPFPYFGGKSRIAAAVWERFGRVNNFVDRISPAPYLTKARPPNVPRS